MHLLVALLALSQQPFEMQAALNDLRQKHNVPALGCGVVQLGSGFGQWVNGIRQVGKADTVARGDTWCIGTNVRAMTGVLVANEVERAALKWNQPIGKPLDLLKMDPSYASATVESLVTMTGGIDPDPSKGWTAYADSDLAKARKQAAGDLLSTKASKAVSGQFLDSNASYVLLSRMVERIEELPAEEVMERAIWQPMPLDAAAWGVNGDNEPCGHDATGMAHPGTDLAAVEYPATAARMSIGNWLQFIVQVIRSFNGSHQYVPAAYENELKAAPMESYCLGWTKTSRPWSKNFVLKQESDDGIQHSVAWVDPIGGLAYVAVCNQGGPQAKAACDEAIQTMIDHGVTKR